MASGDVLHHAAQRGVGWEALTHRLAGWQSNLRQRHKTQKSVTCLFLLHSAKERVIWWHTMRMHWLSTLVLIVPPSLCPCPLGGDISVTVPVCDFCCWLLRSSAIRFNTNSRSWWERILKVFFKQSNIFCQPVLSNQRSPVWMTRLTCCFCLLSALASWARRCLSCASKSLVSNLRRDSTVRGSGDELSDGGDGNAVKSRKTPTFRNASVVNQQTKEKTQNCEVKSNVLHSTSTFTGWCEWRWRCFFRGVECGYRWLSRLVGLFEQTVSRVLTLQEPVVIKGHMFY